MENSKARRRRFTALDYGLMAAAALAFGIGAAAALGAHTYRVAQTQNAQTLTQNAP